MYNFMVHELYNCCYRQRVILVTMAMGIGIPSDSHEDSPMANLLCIPFERVLVSGIKLQL